MDLTVRSIAERDLRACAHLLTGRLAYPEQVVPELPRIWRRLLHEEAMNAVVFENRDCSGRAVMVSFAASVFVTDAWVAAARGSSEPYLTVRTLNVLNLHYIEARGLTPDLARPLRYLVMQAFRESHRGYRIKEVLQELWDELDPEFILNGWGPVRCDYAAYLEGRGEAVPPTGHRPYLIGPASGGAVSRGSTALTPCRACAHASDLCQALFDERGPRVEGHDLYDERRRRRTTARPPPSTAKPAPAPDIKGQYQGG